MFNSRENNRPRSNESRASEDLEVYSEKILTKRRVYYFDVKETKDSDRYLTFTESRKTPRGQQRSRIFISPEDLQNIIENLQKTASFLNSNE